MTVVVFIVPEVPGIAAPDEIRPRTFANIAQFPLGNRVELDQEIRPSTFTNLDSAFFRPRLTTGDEFDIRPSTFTNRPYRVTEDGDVRITEGGDTRIMDGVYGWFGDNQVAESPPDGVIRPSTFSNEAEQVFGAGNEVAESPADGVIRPSTFTNTDQAFGNNIVSPVASEASYGPIDFGPIGGSPI